MTSIDIVRRIDDAAVLLAAVGRADATPGVRVQCLLAAEHLRAAGCSQAVALVLTAPQVEHAIRSALRHLANLPPDVFAHAEILNAAAAARRALVQAEKT